MTRRRDREIVTALDIGTSKVAAIVAEMDEESRELEILGFGSSPSLGMKRGSVVNIEATTRSIDQAVGEAELMSGAQIGDVIVGISGDHVQSLTSHGIVAVGGDEVSETDVARVIEAARAVVVPSDKRVLHVLPRDYVVDDQDGILDPSSMSGVRLEPREPPSLPRMKCSSAAACWTSARAPRISPCSKADHSALPTSFPLPATK